MTCTKNEFNQCNSPSYTLCDECLDKKKTKSYEDGVLKGAEAVILKFEAKYPTMRIIAQIRKDFQIPKRQDYLWSKSQKRKVFKK